MCLVPLSAFRWRSVIVNTYKDFPVSCPKSLSYSLIPDQSLSSRCSVCFRAGSAERGLSTSSLVLSQTLWILRCPAQPQAVHSGRKQRRIKGQIISSSVWMCQDISCFWVCLCKILYRILLNDNWLHSLLRNCHTFWKPISRFLYSAPAIYKLIYDRVCFELTFSLVSLHTSWKQ